MSSCCYRLQAGEPAGADLRRILEEQLDEAIAQLQRARASRRKRVHEARKAIKKTRSALRLIRPAISTDAYNGASTALRSVAQSLAPLRDADVMRDTAAALLYEGKPVAAPRSRTARTSLPPLADSLVQL
ncbi:MAG: CHAD domain-containing protein, partial [Acidobacteria bacterium]|nr:CHAD domain-containing protein [Acidobacteriota bacterium]